MHQDVWTHTGATSHCACGQGEKVTSVLQTGVAQMSGQVGLGRWDSNREQNAQNHSNGEPTIWGQTVVLDDS
jgi:hypothetical protein